MKKGLITSKQNAELLHLLELERHMEILREKAAEIRGKIDPRICYFRVGDTMKKNGKIYKVEGISFHTREYGISSTGGTAKLEVTARISFASQKNRPVDHVKTRTVGTIEVLVKQLDKKIYGKNKGN